MLELLQDRVKAFETMTWKEIRAAGKDHHSISVSRLVKAAQDRLLELELDDTDELFSLRISAKKRLFGIVDRMIFRVLWWDAEHEICPSHKKHT